MMITSMTGYGEAQLETAKYSFLVEIQSLNNRFLKTTTKVPDVLAFAEPEIERLIRSELLRGSVHYTLHFHYHAETGIFEINRAVLQNYLTELGRVLTLQGQTPGLTIDLAKLLEIPGVCELRSFDEPQQRIFLEQIQQLTRQGLQRLKQMRQDEGQTLQGELMELCQTIRQHLAELESLKTGVIATYRRRLAERVNAMLAEANLKLDEDLLIKEVALFAERSDVNEELSRLSSHLTQFERSCQAKEAAGRRLDFLTQEMLREANTIASKSNDAQITHHVVEIKVAIDRLKEQIQNIE
jgi:uncharacterized protein (TIGR00255 family)